MSKSNGFERKFIKVIRLPFVFYLKLRGMKISYSSSMPINTVIENCGMISVGKHCNFDKRTILRCFDFNQQHSQIIFGNNFCGGNDVKILCSGKVIIGDNVSCAGGVFITSENHGLNPLTESFNDNMLECHVTKIGNGVWIGEKAIILPGVEIGEKSVIGAGSVVTKSIPPYSIAVGNPAKVIKTWDFEKNIYVKV